MEAFYKRAGLPELMFLHDAMLIWDQDYAGRITRRCPIADILLSQLGYHAEGYECERIRYYEAARSESIEAT